MRVQVQVAALIAAIILSCATAASAGAAASLTISPAIIRMEATSGETVKQRITVTGSKDVATVVEFRHADFGYDNATYQVQLFDDDAPETTAFSTRGWFVSDRERITIPAGGTRNVPFQVRVPKNTPGGTYLGAALLREVPPAVSTGAPLTAIAETGPLVFITVAGGDPPKPSVARFSVPRFVRSAPISPSLLVRNDGDDYFSFTGTVKLSGPGKSDELEIKQQVVVPDQPRAVRTDPSLSATEGRLKLGTAKLGFGRYRITTRLRIEPTGSTISATRTFWIVPTGIRIALLVALITFAACSALLWRWLASRTRAAALAAQPQPRTDDVDDDEESDIVEDDDSADSDVDEIDDESSDSDVEELIDLDEDSVS